MFTRHRLAVIRTVDAEPTGQQSWACPNPLQLTRQRNRPQQNTVGPIRSIRHHIHAVVDAIADIHIETTRRSKQRFVARRPPPITMTGGVVLGIRLCFHNHAPKQVAVVLAFHQSAANQLRSNNHCRAAKKVLRESFHPATRVTTQHQA